MTSGKVECIIDIYLGKNSFIHYLSDLLLQQLTRNFEKYDNKRMTENSNTARNTMGI